MKNKLIITILLQILVSTAVQASPVGETNTIIQTSIETNGYRFTACFTNANLHVGDPVNVTTVLKSTSTNDRTIVLASPLRMYDIKIVRDGSKAVAMTPYGGASKLGEISIAKRKLEPGEVFTNSFQIDKFFDMSAAGDYEITMSRWIWIREGALSSTITAPPVRIAIKPLALP